VGLAITGTIFGSVLLQEMPGQIVKAGVPQEVAKGFAAGGSSTLNNLSGVGDLGARILAGMPADVRAQVAPFIDGIVKGIHEAFSIATASTFTVGIITALLAALLVVVGLPGARMGATADAGEKAA